MAVTHTHTAFWKAPSVAGKNLLVAPDVPGVTLNPTMCTLLDGTARHHEPEAAFIAWADKENTEIHAETGMFCSYRVVGSEVVVLQVSFEHSACWFQHSHWCELHQKLQCPLFFFIYFFCHLHFILQQWGKKSYKHKISYKKWCMF